LNVHYLRRRTEGLQFRRVDGKSDVRKIFKPLDGVGIVKMNAVQQFVLRLPDDGALGQ
jgi:hypothetical protein